MDWNEKYFVSKKQGFDQEYNAPVPTPLARRYQEIGYRIPEFVGLVYKTLCQQFPDLPGDCMLDLCSSYGFNFAVTDQGVGYGNLLDDWAEEAGFPVYNRHGQGKRVVFDSSANAVSFAVAQGLADVGIARNLETEHLNEAEKAVLADVRTILCGGSYGYITNQTVFQLLDAIDLERGDFLMINFVMRQFSYDALSEFLAGRNYKTLLSRFAFPQRRVMNQPELDAAVEQMEKIGIDPSPEIRHAMFYADLYVSFPDRPDYTLAIATAINDPKYRAFGAVDRVSDLSEVACPVPT